MPEAKKSASKPATTSTTAAARKSPAKGSSKKPAVKAAARKNPAVPPAKAPGARRGPKLVTDEHKAAMLKGRRASSAVGAYLQAVESAKPRRRRELSVEELNERLVEARAAVASETGIQKLSAAQHVIDLEQRLLEADVPATDLAALEDAFVEWAPVYAESKGISYPAFRAAGVPAAVLKRAGISRAK